jgi:hypothetical protein
VSLSDDELKIGDETWKEGDQQCDGEDAELVVARWEDVSNQDAQPVLLKSGFDRIRFRADGEGYTIAFVPEGETDIPRPPNADRLAQLGAVDAAQTATTDAEGNVVETTTTTAGESTTTTAETTTTTAGG